MFDVRFELLHRGCWMHGLAAFSCRFSSHITFRVEEGVSCDILHAEGNPAEFLRIEKFVKSHKTVRSVHRLGKDQRNLYLQIYSDVSGIRSVIGTIIDHGAFVIRPVGIVQGKERWSVIMPSKRKLPTLLKSLRRCGEVKLLGVERAGLDLSDLTEKQRDALELAIALGYYEWPRRVSAKELARRLGVSGSSLLQRLRVAEAKLVKNAYHAR